MSRRTSSNTTLALACSPRCWECSMQGIAISRPPTAGLCLTLEEEDWSGDHGVTSYLFFLKTRRRACHPERSARNARVAKDLLLALGIESRSFAPAALRMTGSLALMRKRGEERHGRLAEWRVDEYASETAIREVLAATPPDAKLKAEMPALSTVHSATTQVRGGMAA